MEQLEASAMGTTVRIQGQGAGLALAEIRRLEALLTRFGPSPLTRLNQQGFLPDPPKDLLGALHHALLVARQTGGLVTPTVLGALEHAGYRQSLEAATPVPAGGNPPPVPDWRGIRLSPDRIDLPRAVGLDLGGSAKTWIAQQAAQKLQGPFVLDAGGDLLLELSRPEVVATERPGGKPPIGAELPAGRWGVATSSLLKRAWKGGHHLIDPRTRRPLQSRWVQATAIDPEATWAEVWSKLALLEPRRLPQGAWVMVFDAAGEAYRWAGYGFIPLEVAA